MKLRTLAATLLVAGLLLPLAGQEQTTELPPGLYATLSTSMGTIKVRLFEEEAPEAVRNFAELAQGKRLWQETPSNETVLGEPYFDGLLFHRVIPGFMIQTGGIPPYGQRISNVIPDEFDNGLEFDRGGLLGMANTSSPGTTRAQFFITLGPQSHLNGKHTIFGEVVSGQKVVTRIGDVSRDKSDRPINDVTLFRVTIERVGPAPSPMTAPGLYAQLETSLGTVTIRLAEKEAPQTVAHFTALAQGKKRWRTASAGEDWREGEPYYDGLIFHRVMKNFVSQSGGHQPDGVQRVSDVVADEFDNGLKFDQPGRVGMAHSGPGTARAQFFITHLAPDALNGKYTVFGQVVDGMDVVWKMSKGNLLPNASGDDAVPDPPILLNRVTIHRVE